MAANEATCTAVGNCWFGLRKKTFPWNRREVRGRTSAQLSPVVEILQRPEKKCDVSYPPKFHMRISSEQG